MNHNCHGEFFIANGARHYRCFADSSVISSAVCNGDQCPSCDRTIVATSAGADTAANTSVSERTKRAEKHVNEQLSYGGIYPGTGPFGRTLEYRYHDGDLVAEIGQMRRLADALNNLADTLESEAD